MPSRAFPAPLKAHRRLIFVSVTLQTDHATIVRPVRVLHADRERHMDARSSVVVAGVDSPRRRFHARFSGGVASPYFTLDDWPMSCGARGQQIRRDVLPNAARSIRLG